MAGSPSTSRILPCGRKGRGGALKQNVCMAGGTKLAPARKVFSPQRRKPCLVSFGMEALEFEQIVIEHINGFFSGAIVCYGAIIAPLAWSRDVHGFQSIHRP